MKSALKIINKEKRLGSSKNRRQYDLPLNKSAGANFLTLLIALMTFLVVLALAGSMALGTVAGKWSSGLENKATIEIPAEKSDGSARTREQIEDFTAEIVRMLAENKAVKEYTVLGKDDIAELVSPWLGTEMALDDIPLPGLISLHLHQSSPEIIDQLVQNLALINDNIRIDTHEAWLTQLLNITHTLQSAALFVIIVIAATTITAIAGGVRSRMAIHRADIELLHLMGASDDYITKQFQRQALVMAAQGSLIGGIMAAITLCAVAAAHFSGLTSVSISEYLDIKNIAFVLLIPVMACFISTFTARATVLRELSLMP